MDAITALTARGTARLRELGLAGRELGARGALARALGWSDFLHRFLLRRDGTASEFLATARQPLRRRDLRVIENVETGLARIALRELTGLHDVRCSLLAATILAEATLARAIAVENDGGSNFVVFGLGKLGGRELNFYSDLDLVFAYAGVSERDELTQVRRARRVLARLEGGFRIDLRLRPFGQSGPPVMSLGAMETYFQNHGREWERYAWIKARAVAGDRAAGRKFLERIDPFLYRRYLDYHAIDALREMKRQIAEEAGTSTRDIKRGPGGIREIEFVIQAFQLVRGGRTAALTGTGLAGALAAAVNLRLLDAAAGSSLVEAYRFLRRLENRLQAQALAPTHRLPEDRDRLVWLAGSLGYGDWPALAGALEFHRDHVRRIFEEIFGRPRGGRTRSAAARMWQGEGDDEEMSELGFVDTPAMRGMLAGFKDSRAVRLMSARGRLALDHAVPALIAAASALQDPDAVLVRLVTVLAALVRRSAYVALLAERPAARQRLAELVGRSAWLAERLAATPAVLDELLDARLAAAASRPRLVRLLRDAAAMPAADAAAERLREVNESQRLKIAAGLADGSLTQSQAERALTLLAELSVRVALGVAARRMVQRHGMLRHELLAIGYGKLGSRELGLASDLDIVFIYVGEQAAAPDGLAAETYLARLAQRAISLLSMPTAAGRLYSVDTRLRPEGAAGLLLSRFEAWRRYQNEHAWLWERQALLRARAVAGSAALVRRFERERRVLLARALPRAVLARGIADMRRRVAASGPPRAENAATLLDGEFLAAFWLLHAAPDMPTVVRSSVLRRQLEELARRRRMPQARELADALDALRAATTRAVLGLPADAAAERRARERIRSLWREELAAPPL